MERPSHSSYKGCSYEYDIFDNKGYKHTCVPQKGKKQRTLFHIVLEDIFSQYAYNCNILK